MAPPRGKSAIVFFVRPNEEEAFPKPNVDGATDPSTCWNCREVAAIAAARNGAKYTLMVKFYFRCVCFFCFDGGKDVAS